MLVRDGGGVVETAERKWEGEAGGGGGGGGRERLRFSYMILKCPWMPLVAKFTPRLQLGRHHMHLYATARPYYAYKCQYMPLPKSPQMSLSSPYCHRNSISCCLMSSHAAAMPLHCHSSRFMRSEMPLPQLISPLWSVPSLSLSSDASSCQENAHAHWPAVPHRGVSNG